MTELQFVSTMEDIAFLYCYDMGPHGYFINDVHTICGSIQKVFTLNRSLFQTCMRNLHKTAAYMDHAELDMPLHFDMFLPLRLPMAVHAVFKEKERTVRLGRPNFIHPFFCGNVLNPHCINLMLQSEMNQVVAHIGSVLGQSGVLFELSYTALTDNYNVPFVHQLVAEARIGPHSPSREKNEMICIRFDFVLALEFDVNSILLPPYFKPPTQYKWLAYGMVHLSSHQDPADWAVLLPKWQYAHLGTLLRGLNMSVMLYRMLYNHGCYRFALPAVIKFGYFLTIEDRGIDYMRMTVAELMVATLGHQLSRNLCAIVSTNAVTDEQQKCAQEIHTMLSNALQFNVISVDVIYQYFRIRYIPPTPCRLNRSLENLRAPVTPPTSVRSRIRRRSI